MKLTRQSLKELIIESLREKESILLEMPKEVPYKRAGGDDEEEGAAAKKDLFHMSQKAQQLHDMLADDEALEPWVQAKVTKASAMIGAVFDHLMYQKRPGYVKE